MEIQRLLRHRLTLNLLIVMTAIISGCSGRSGSDVRLTPVVLKFRLQPPTAEVVQDAATPTVITLPTSHPSTVVIRPTTTTGSSPGPTVTPIPSPTQHPTVTAIPTQVADPVTLTPALPVPMNVTTTGPPGSSSSSQMLYSGPFTSNIKLVDPAPGFKLPSEANQWEFKWQWFGGGEAPCRVPAKHGFQVRIWADPNQLHLSPADRLAIEPLGVIDAAAEQEMIANSCDPKSGELRLLVRNLAGVPGIAKARGIGHFFWDVTYAQLEPYYVDLAASIPHDFFIPGELVIVADPTATPAYQLTPLPRPDGVITPLNPPHLSVFPVNFGPVLFQWRWTAQAPASQSPCSLADGYGFELRIWSPQPGFHPEGVIDVTTGQDLITCDPETGIYSYIQPDLIQAPGVQKTYKGEFRWDGKFQWDVALLSVRPYLPAETSSPPSIIEISLSPYSGPVDRSGRTLRCSEMSSWPQAQAVFLAVGPTQAADLDPDGNKIACDELRQ